MDKTKCIHAKRLPVCESNEPLKLGHSPPPGQKKRKKKKTCKQRETSLKVTKIFKWNIADKQKSLD